MLNYKRPKFWVFVFSIVIVAVITIGLISNSKDVEIIGSTDETADKIIITQKGFVLAESDRVTLYANNEKEGMYERITVLTKDNSKTFSWANVTNQTYAPTINISDINNDDKDEVIIILTTGYGTNVLQQEIHILNMEDLTEINLQNPIETINKKVTSTIAKNESNVDVSIKWDGNVIEKRYNESDAGIWFDKVEFGSIIKYEIIAGKITVIVPGAVSPSEFPVTVLVEYGPDFEVDTITIKD